MRSSSIPRDTSRNYNILVIVSNKRLLQLSSVKLLLSLLLLFYYVCDQES